MKFLIPESHWLYSITFYYSTIYICTLKELYILRVIANLIEINNCTIALMTAQLTKKHKSNHNLLVDLLREILSTFLV